jgi:Ca2+-binding RTX toxin-like protein
MQSVEGGPDALLGGRGNDVMGGGQGDDFLRGQLGRDDLEGKANNDRLLGDNLVGAHFPDQCFVNVSRGDGNDSILDLTEGDRLALSGELGLEIEGILQSIWCDTVGDCDAVG